MIIYNGIEVGIIIYNSVRQGRKLSYFSRRQRMWYEPQSRAAFRPRLKFPSQHVLFFVRPLRSSITAKVIPWYNKLGRCTHHDTHPPHPATSNALIKKFLLFRRFSISHYDNTIQTNEKWRKIIQNLVHCHHT